MRLLTLLFRQVAPLVGLDIGSSAVKVVEMGARRRGTVAAGWAPTPFGSIVDGVIVERKQVAAVVRQAFEAGGIRSRRVAVALPGTVAVIKRIAVRPQPQIRLPDAVAREAARHLPFHPDDVHVDYHRIASRDSGAADPIHLLLVAARRQTVAAYVDVVKEAGCTPVVMDVGALALQNVLEWAERGEPDSEAVLPTDHSVALLDVGASATTVHVARAGVPLFARDVPTGGNACTEALQRELDLTFDAAERLKLGLPVPEWTLADAMPVVRGAADALALEVRRTLDFVETGAAVEGADQSCRIDRIVLTGGASRIRGLESALRTHFSGPVERFDPLRRLTRKSRAARDSVGFDALRASGGIAIGLALRGLDLARPQRGNQ